MHKDLLKQTYELNYSVAIGNILTEPEIEACEELGRPIYSFKLYEKIKSATIALNIEEFNIH